jgi:hypothetical protein
VGSGRRSLAAIRATGSRYRRALVRPTLAGGFFSAGERCGTGERRAASGAALKVVEDLWQIAMQAVEKASVDHPVRRPRRGQPPALGPAAGRVRGRD